jgi:hypothetical protein
MMTFGRCLLALELAVFMAGAARIGAAQIRPEKSEVHGKLMGTTDAKVIVQPSDGGAVVTLAVAPDARITRDGAGARLFDLAVGDLVNVTMERRTAGLLATVIVAQTPY